MKALIFDGVNSVSLKEKPKPTLQSATDAIVRVTKTTICGTDLHIVKGDVPTCKPGLILGHEGVGIVQSVGSSVRLFAPGDHVLISCISKCGRCKNCLANMYSHCTSGGWRLGNSVDGTQAEYVRILHADLSMYAIPTGIDEAAAVMLSDVFPTAFECGVLNSGIQPGATMVVVGAGPIGLATIMMAQMYSPSMIIVVDIDDARLGMAKDLGATFTINSTKEDVSARVRMLTRGQGCSAAVEAAGLPATFAMCEASVAPGGVIANVGVHGTHVKLHLERLWDRNISIKTRLVDTVSTPSLVAFVEAGKLLPKRLISNRYHFDSVELAYRSFQEASKTGAVKVLIDFEEESPEDLW